MKIYMVNSSEGYELCQPVEQNDFERINVLINGVVRRQSWLPINMRVITKDEGEALRESDSPWLGSHALIFRKRAVEKLRVLLEEYGELLPLAATGVELYVYNPTTVLDALDESASGARRFSSGRIMNITRYVFKPEIIRNSGIFKLSCVRVSPTFAHQEFVDLWAAANLRGLEFKLIYEES